MADDAPKAGDEPKWKKCPFCAEDIRAEAVVCRHCNRDIAQAPAQVVPSSAQIVQQGVAKDAERRNIQGEVRRRRANARLVGAACFGAVCVSIYCYYNGHTSPGHFFIFAALVLLIAYFIVRPRYTGAECPHCHGFAVRSVTKSGIVSSQTVLKCDDCLAEFGGVGGGCGCAVLFFALGMIGSMMGVLLAFVR